MSGNTGTDIWVAGAFAAFTVDLLIYPLDTIKTRIQSPDYRKLYVDQTNNRIKTGALFRGLYQGLGSIIITTLPASGAFFTSYEYGKVALNKINPRSPFRQSTSDDGQAPLLVPQPLVHSAASAMAELVSCAILTPAEVIKQNAQMVGRDGSQASATVQTLRRFRNQPLALWRGYGALAGRNLPHTAIQFPLFEQLKTNFKAWRGIPVDAPEEDISFKEHAIVVSLAAAGSGFVAAVVTTPIDVIKTRIMLAAGAEAGASDVGPKSAQTSKNGQVIDALGNLTDSKSAGNRKSSWTVGKEVWAESGLQGLMRGGLLRGVWTAIGMGCYLSMYNIGLVYLARRRKNED